MNCPVCGREMRKGGLVAEKAIAVAWHPGSEFEKKGLQTLNYKYRKLPGTHHPFRGTATIPDAWYCEHC